VTPERAIARLRGFCEDRERRHAEHGQRGGVPYLTVPEIRAIVDDVEIEEEAVLRITEREAAWILGRWTAEKADLAARALAEHAHAERAAGREDTATQALDLADEIVEASR
jgi:hypothetical protein